MAYGSSNAHYQVSTGSFIARYFMTALIGFFGIMMCGVVTALTAVAFKRGSDGSTSVLITMGMMLLTAYAGYLLAAPYLQASIFNLTWSNTRFDNVRIQSDLNTNDYIKLQAANTVLTLLTIGLYRPFAVMRTLRYRLENTHVESSEAFEQVLAGQRRPAAGASGDSSADLFGFDLSW
jgi:uncharacterized membrane protein YjgN (DUF898 family)